jgi:hypothetical protein
MLPEGRRERSYENNPLINTSISRFSHALSESNNEVPRKKEDRSRNQINENFRSDNSDDED